MKTDVIRRVPRNPHPQTAVRRQPRWRSQTPGRTRYTVPGYYLNTSKSLAYFTRFPVQLTGYTSGLELALCDVDLGCCLLQEGP